MTEHSPIDSPGRLDSELCYLTDCAALWLIVKFISLYNEVRLYRVVHFDVQLPGYLHVYAETNKNRIYTLGHI